MDEDEIVYVGREARALEAGAVSDDIFAPLHRCRIEIRDRLEGSAADKIAGIAQCGEKLPCALDSARGKALLDLDEKIRTGSIERYCGAFEHRLLVTLDIDLHKTQIAEIRVIQTLGCDFD